MPKMRGTLIGTDLRLSDERRLAKISVPNSVLCVENARGGGSAVAVCRANAAMWMWTSLS